MAMENISPESTIKKLESALIKYNNIADDSLALELKTNNPEANYYKQIPRDKITVNTRLLKLFSKQSIDKSKLLEIISM